MTFFLVHVCETFPKIQTLSDFLIKGTDYYFQNRKTSSLYKLNRVRKDKI